MFWLQSKEYKKTTQAVKTNPHINEGKGAILTNPHINEGKGAFFYQSSH